MSTQKKQPIWNKRAGKIILSAWRNPANEPGKNTSSNLSFKIQRSYKSSKTGQWVNESLFLFLDDLRDLDYVVQSACQQFRDESKENTPTAS